MLLHNPDTTLKNLSSAQKRIEHFALEGNTDKTSSLFIAYSNMMLAWPENDPLEQLILLDWISAKVNQFCDSNKVSDNLSARALFAKLKPLFFADFSVMVK
jgi:hypothetical protein